MAIRPGEPGDLRRDIPRERAISKFVDETH
jgi:hypothetical protein